MDGTKRLATFAGHLVDERPLHKDKSGTLTLIDNRTNATYTIPIGPRGTIRAVEFKRVRTDDADPGLKIYDPGYMNTAPVISRVSFIDGAKGILRYRGYPIEQLAEKSSFIEVAYLLMYGELPTRDQFDQWNEAVMRHTALPASVRAAIDALPHDAHPMGTILTGMCALSTFHPEQNPAMAGQSIYQSKAVQDKQIVRILGKIPALAALAYHRASGRRAAEPNQSLGYVENFMYMLDAGPRTDYKPHPRLVRILDILFILHAEHEMNCSTAAVRHLASSGVDVFTAVAGALGALYGPLHGGANEAVLHMLERIGDVKEIPAFLEKVKRKEVKLSGFGHRVYKNFDPRATIIRKLADEVFSIVGHDRLIEVAVALMNAALADTYFVERKLYPNVDFFSGMVYRALGFPPQYFTVLFGIPRIAGYLAHWRESLSDPDTRILRPQQDYDGIMLRAYQDMDDRKPTGDSMDDITPSNAYKRRIAGVNWK